MDRSTLTGFILIGLILIVWISINAPPPKHPAPGKDSIAIGHQPRDTSKAAAFPKTEPVVVEDTLGKYFGPLAKGQEKTFEVETEHYLAKISTKGGTVRHWELKEFRTWNKYPVNLINDEKRGDLNLLFYSSDGKRINTKNLYFETGMLSGKHVIMKGDSLSIDLVMNVSPHSRIVKRLVFYEDRYSFDVIYEFVGMNEIISNFEYQVTWESGLSYAEHNSIDESSSAMAYALAGGELTETDATRFDEPVRQNISGRIDWVATRTKYFALAIIPKGSESQGAFLEGVRIKLPDNGAREDYNIALKMPFLGKDLETSRFSVFLGPLNFDIIRSYHVGLDQIMSLGAAWIIRPISEYVMIPLFQFLHLFIPNYGFVIIVFSIIIKVALHPLTKTSMTSMRKMQGLQPMMNEIREKYKDDPQKMNQQVMRLYKEYGVNPAGGCLPMLLQLPILYALWAVFRSTIELRQAAFIGWIHDLSIPDVVTSLPFSIPFFNITEVSGLALLMGITMFVQQKMTVKDPRQKMMVWLMPVMLTLLFNSFPAGLNLYYFVFNLLSIAQQAWVNKQHKDEPLRKVEPKKKPGGLIGRIIKNLPKAPR